MNYYNEYDPLKAEVLREAIKAGAIAPGHVDERSIKDVKAAELLGYIQCHFFAGGGFWSLALRLAGWPDDKRVWTGSCPCPSFSAAGKGGGFDDPRHLWPDWAKLIIECRPPVVFGEQADDAVGYGWLDLVQANMEAATYALGKIVFGAHSVGAPHIRQRICFVADTDGGQPGHGNLQCSREQRLLAQDRGFSEGAAYRVGPDASSLRYDGWRPGEESNRHAAAERITGQLEPQRPCDAGNGSDTERDGGWSDLEGRSAQGRAAHGRDCAAGDGENPVDLGCEPRRTSEPGHQSGDALAGDGSEPSIGGHAQHQGLQECQRNAGVPGGADGAPSGQEPERGSNALRPWRGTGWLDPATARNIAASGATRGFWADCDWWYGRDGKYRPIGPGIQPLAHGSPARVGRLRMYGDGIVVTQATEFIKAYTEARGLTF